MALAHGGDQDTQPNNMMMKTARGYLKSQAKNSQAPLVKRSEYTFFKKKVRLNVVEKKVHKFTLNEEEVNLKKAKKKTSTRKNF